MPRRRKAQGLLKNHEKNKKKDEKLRLELEELEAVFSEILKKSQSNFQYDLNRVGNFQNHERVWKSLEDQWNGFFISQVALEGSRQLSLNLVSLLNYIFSFYYGGSAAKILSAYSEIRIISQPFRSGLGLLINPALKVSHIKKLSDHSQPFSKNVKFHKPPKYLSYLPTLIGISRLILNSSFLQFLQEEFSQSSYALYGASLVVIAEVLSYFSSDLLTKQLVKMNSNSEHPTTKEIFLFDSLEKSCESLNLSSLLILLSGIGYGLLAPMIVPMLLSSSLIEEFNSEFQIGNFDSSLLLEKFDWSFGLNALIAFLITRFFYNWISKQESPLRVSLAKKFSDSLNKKFKNVISSSVKTYHDLIHVESLDKEDKSVCQFFSLALSMYCKASITGEIENQFLLALFHRFDPEEVINKLTLRFKIYNQLQKLSQSVNWQELNENCDEKLFDSQPTFTPFNRGNKISWIIELHEFDKSIQNSLKNRLIDLYIKKNTDLKVNIENGSLIIHGLKMPSNNRNICFVNKESDPIKTKSKKLFSSSSEYNHHSNPSTMDFSGGRIPRTGKRKSTFTEEDKNSKSDQELTTEEKWKNIKETAKALCEQARKKLTNSARLKFKGGDPAKDAFFALIKTQNSRPEYITCVIWAQNLTSESLKIIENPAHKQHFQQLLIASKQKGYVKIASRTHKNTGAGIVKSDQGGCTYKLYDHKDGYRCGIVPVPLSQFFLRTHSDGNPVKLAIMDTEQYLPHKQFDRRALTISHKNF